MRTLAIETAGRACSVALFDDDALIAEDHDEVGRGHAERLLPMIAGLPDGGWADLIVADCGPGSFTGIRVGLSAAIGLGIGWDARVQAYSSLALIAASAMTDNPLAVVIEGGHGQVFAQMFAVHPLRPESDVRSLSPADAADWTAGRELVRDRTVRARDVATLPPALLGLPPVPIYGRGADARPMR